MQIFIPIPYSCQSIPVNDMLVSTPIQTNPCPHHHGPTSVSVVFKDIAVGIMLSRPSPHPYTSATRENKDAWLICEEHWTPVAQLPILVIQCKFKSGSTVLWQKNGTTYRASAVEIILMESVSNSLVTDTHTGGLVEVHLQCSGSLLAAVKCHLPDVTVLMSCATS